MGLILRTYSDPNPPTYQQWYQSPLLEEGYHSIILSNIAGDASVDFAVVTMGEDTPLNGTLIIADNDDLGFNYTGKWSRSQHLFIPGYQKPDGYPYHNSTHQTSEVGSSFTYQFTGMFSTHASVSLKRFSYFFRNFYGSLWHIYLVQSWNNDINIHPRWPKFV